MAAGRFRKRLARSLMVSWRDQPTRYDIEALQANIQRVGLVVRVRWMLIIVLVVYSVVGAALYTTRMTIPELAGRMWIPAVALGLVVLYNFFYTQNYRRLGAITVWNNLQLALDAIVVTILVYFSGGADSWFWSMYSLFILEAAFILPRKRSTWLISGLCVLLLGTIEIAELFRIFPHVQMPFSAGSLYNEPVYVLVRFLWQVTVLAGTASVSTLLVGHFRSELEARSSQTILDNTTGLFSRGYFTRVYPTELRRAQRDGLPLYVILLDVDNFGAFNERFGVDMGDELLKAVATEINAVVSDVGDVSAANIVARIGGEEFAVIFTEDQTVGRMPRDEDAMALAARIRGSVQATAVRGAGVTVSVGVASLQRDGSTPEGLLDAADAALALAIERGGNQVVSSDECSPRSAAEDYANLED